VSEPRDPTRAREAGHPLAELVLVRFREFVREPEAVFWSFVFPILLALGLGIAFRNRPPETVKVGVAGAGAAADSLALALRGAPGLLAERVGADDDGARALRVGRVALVVTPRGGSWRGGVEYRFDPTRPDARTARQLVDDALQRAAGRRDPLAVAERRVEERGSRYIDFLVPGLLGMTIMGDSMWGVGFTIVDTRRKHLLKRLVATPMSRAHYLLSFILARLVFVAVSVTVVLGFARLVFDVPMRGSLAQVAVVGFAASLAFSGLGLLTASRARTIESASGLMNVAMFPMWVASGIFFASSNFPDAAQPFIQALPLTAVIDALRGTMLQGIGWGAVLPELGIVAAWGLASFALALGIFRWR
jgi:ABC-type multidrug transport system permease subunit